MSRIEDINIIPPSLKRNNCSAKSGSLPSANKEIESPKQSYSSEYSDTETETEMSDRKSEKLRDSSKSSSSKPGSYSSSKSSPKQSKKDDWSDVMEPDERRRIQNRIAQRKFREKAKEKREAEERDAENRQHAGLAYTTPRPSDIVADSDLSGLPWGGVSMRHIVGRGQMREAESRRGSQEPSCFNYRTGGGRGAGSDPR